VLRISLLAILTLFTGVLHAADVAARLEWTKRVPLGSCASALVESVHVDVGDRVQVGQIVAELDPAPAIARLERAQAILARVRPEFEERTIELDHAEELFERTVLSEVELRRAEIRHAVAAATVAEAEADLKSAEAGVECRKVRSPLDGVVVARAVERGQPVVGSERAPTLVVVAAAGQMDAVTDVSVDALSTVKRGTHVVVYAGAERYHGRVVFVGLEPSSMEPLGYPVRVRFATPEGQQLRAGMPAVIELP